MLPPGKRIAHPVFVPRSSDKIASEGAARPVAGGLGSAWGSVRLVEAMMVSVEGSVVVRTATEWFLAELSVVVRLVRWPCARRADGVGLSERDDIRTGAHHSTSLSQSGGGEI